jgi:hypothetical protein
MRIPLDVPGASLGRRLKLEVGAKVRYPSERGRMLRFRDGLRVGLPAGGDAFHTAMALAGALTGTVVISRPASATIMFPPHANRSPPQDSPIETEILWRPGDPVDPVVRRFQTA